ncbi:MAG: putative Ig domain-containing protein, partial [Nitrospira sp.]|nr:putative Ig domain-containing protein [Nitrospira sp.]
SGDVEVWLLNGTAIASTGSLGLLPSQWKIVQIGDADGDGKADVIWRNSDTGSVVLWLLNGLIVSSDGSPGTTSTDWIIASRPGLPVTPTPLPLIISSATTLPPGTVGQAYNMTLSASGGTPPFSWSITSGSLPGGLNLNPSTGRISGTPTGANTFTPTIRVQDSGSPPQTNQKQFSLTITSATSGTGTPQFLFAQRTDTAGVGGGVAGGGPIIAVDPSNPGATPITVTSAATTAAFVFKSSWDAAIKHFTNIQEALLVYVSGGKLWRVATAKSSGIPGSGANPPVQFSNESGAGIICALFVIGPASTNPTTTRMAYELPGADGVCSTRTNNVTKIVSVSDSNLTPPFVLPTGLTLTEDTVPSQLPIYNLSTGAPTHFFVVDAANNKTLKIFDLNTKTITPIQANFGMIQILAQDTSDRVFFKNTPFSTVLYVYTISTNSLVSLFTATGILGLWHGQFDISDGNNLYVADGGTLYQLPITATTPSDVKPILNIPETISGIHPSKNRIYVAYQDFNSGLGMGLLSIPKGGGAPRIEVPIIPGQTILGLPFNINDLEYYTIVNWTPGTNLSPITSATAVIRREDGSTVLSQPNAWLTYGLFERRNGVRGDGPIYPSSLFLLTSPGMSFNGGTLSLIDPATVVQGITLGTIPAAWDFPVTTGPPFIMAEFDGNGALGFADSGEPQNLFDFNDLIFFIDTTKPNSLIRVPVSGSPWFWIP